MVLAKLLKSEVVWDVFGRIGGDVEVSAADLGAGVFAEQNVSDMWSASGDAWLNR